MEHVWFITGSSRGFGRALVQAALDAGDLVVATARRPGQLADLTQRYGDRMLPLSQRELTLLTVLARRRGEVVSRAQLFELAWGRPLSRTDVSSPAVAQSLIATSVGGR